MSVRQKNIVLIGFMGVGKTTIGELVAKKLYRTFIDVDKEIEKDFGMTIPEIFEKHGEPFFRDYEKKKTCALAEEKLKVLSIGGGAFVQPEIRQACLDNCVVFYLDMAWEEWKERLDMLIDSRPVLQTRDITEIEELFYKRQDAYSINHSTLTISNRSAEEVADFIVDSLKHTWDMYEPMND
ncbi:shikimate kinase [Domibacillus epiphyticus]|uniref:Shikimate kinase n=1 Tax=Domibacillus epiphyticus TaxID=1714355 RepID=A0A1V2A6A4_9BACI|nr:shikimate kinase [Domibacillus epiphyticus]OMP66518.1 shikimate kinase [Domibacillus epiphyticus]